MTVGVEIKNDHDTYQISDGTVASQGSNLVLKNVVTATFSRAQSPYNFSSMCVISYTGKAPLVAFTSTFPVAFYSSNLVNGVWYSRYIAPATNDGGTATFLIYDESSQALIPTNNYGVEIFDENGNRVYHTAHQPCKIGWWSEYATATYPPNRVYAVMPVSTAYGVDVFQQPPQLNVSGLSISGATVTVTTFAIGAATSDGMASFGSGQFSVLDITGNGYAPGTVVPVTSISPMNWSNISSDQNTETAEVTNQELIVSGLSAGTGAVLKGTVTNVSGGLNDNSYMFLKKNGSNVATTLPFPTNGGWHLTNGMQIQTNVVNGDRIQWGMGGKTTQRATVSATMIVSDASTGVGVGTFGASLTLGQTAPVEDNTPDPTTFGPINYTTNDPTGWSGTASAITGINVPITLRVERYNYSGNLTTAIVHVYKGPSVNGPWTGLGSFNALNAGNQYLDFTITNGEYVHYVLDGQTTSGRRSGSMTITVWNLTRNENISSINNTMVVDNDDNYNTSQPTITISGNMEERNVGGQSRQSFGVYSLSGLPATPSSYYWEVLNDGGGQLFQVQGTNSTFTVSGPPYNRMSFTTTYDFTIQCTVVINGVTYVTPMKNGAYSVDSGGGGGIGI